MRWSIARKNKTKQNTASYLWLSHRNLKKKKKKLKQNLPLFTLWFEHLCSCTVAALGLGAALGVAARPQARICSLWYLALSKHHGGFKLLLDFLDLVQHGLEVGAALQWERVVLWRVSIQVEKKRRVLDLKVCARWAFLVRCSTAVESA